MATGPRAPRHRCQAVRLTRYGVALAGPQRVGAQAAPEAEGGGGPGATAGGELELPVLLVGTVGRYWKYIEKPRKITIC